MKYADFEKIKTVVGDVYEENSDIMCQLPIDVFKLAKKMGFRIFKSSERLAYGANKVEDYAFFNSGKNVFGYTFYDPIAECYVIYIDDTIANRKKQRFSLAHEIGHIVLGHIIQYRNDIACEKEADYFAGYLLCPECLAINRNIMQAIQKDYLLLGSIFGVAIDTASIKYEHFLNRSSLKNAKQFEYENIILNCLESEVLLKIKKSR